MITKSSSQVTSDLFLSLVGECEGTKSNAGSYPPISSVPGGLLAPSPNQLTAGYGPRYHMYPAFEACCRC